MSGCAGVASGSATRLLGVGVNRVDREILEHSLRSITKWGSPQRYNTSLSIISFFHIGVPVRRQNLYLHRPLFACRSILCRGLSSLPTNVNTPSSTPVRNRKSRNPRQNAKSVLRELMIDIREIRQTIVTQLPALPPATWTYLPNTLSDSTREEIRIKQLREDLHIQTTSVYQSLLSCVEAGLLSPASTHQHEVSIILRHIMALYRESHVSSSDSSFPYDMMETVLTQMRNWKLSPDPSTHGHIILEAAVREQRWAAAAGLFWHRIDPDHGGSKTQGGADESSGMVPVSIDALNPLGLYAIARCAQQEQRAVVENVMDAVERMTMWSPGESKQCK
jgi:hypothetical protein